MEFVGITTTGWSAIIVTASMAVLTGIMFILGRERVHFLWGWLCFSVTIWIGAFYGVIEATDSATAEIWWKISYVGIILIPFFFLHFVYEFVDTVRLKKIKWIVIPLIYLGAAVFVYLDLKTDLIIDGVQFLFGEFYYGKPGFLHPYFTMLYGVLVFYAFYLVYKGYREKDDKLFRQRAIYFFIANLLAFAGGSLNFLPIYGIEVPPISNLAVAFGAALIAYAILRYQLFDAKVVTAQLLTLILAAFAFIRLILSASAQEAVVSSLVLLLTLIIGIYLILSVRKEVEHREQIEKLAGELKMANEGQANLLHIINHQIKGYMTKARLVFDDLLEDKSYGLSDKAQPIIKQGFDSVTEGVNFVEGFLHASNIERGTFTYNFEPMDFAEVVKEEAEEQKRIAESKGLTFTLSIMDGNYKMIGDRAQLIQVVKNLIDNSIKYTPSGSIAVSLSKNSSGIILNVTDTGVGLSDEVKPKLFTKGGRDKDSQKINIDSTGFGLVFVRGVVEAHQGRVSALSDGPGKGSTFSLELRHSE